MAKNTFYRLTRVLLFDLDHFWKMGLVEMARWWKSLMIPLDGLHGCFTTKYE
jgi:hypothetical protein